MKNKTKKNISNIIKFKDYPDFTPNLLKQMFELGSFGGTYWRQYIHLLLKRIIKTFNKYPKSWWKNVPERIYRVLIMILKKKIQMQSGFIIGILGRT